jgi:hypothetical protein
MQPFRAPGDECEHDARDHTSREDGLPGRDLRAETLDAHQHAGEENDRRQLECNAEQDVPVCRRGH